MPQKKGKQEKLPESFTRLKSPRQTVRMVLQNCDLEPALQNSGKTPVTPNQSSHVPTKLPGEDNGQTTDPPASKNDVLTFSKTPK